MRVSTFLLRYIYTHRCILTNFFLSNQKKKWVIDAMAPDKKDSVVKAKQLEALKRLGHSELKLDEYERV